MKKLFEVIGNILSFGIPLFIRVLSKARKFQALVDSHVVVKVNTHRRTVTCSSPIGFILELSIDEIQDEV